jgi:hypothetical protein
LFEGSDLSPRAGELSFQELDALHVQGRTQFVAEKKHKIGRFGDLRREGRVVCPFNWMIGVLRRRSVPDPHEQEALNF